jgi:hypothetical protein
METAFRSTHADTVYAAGLFNGDSLGESRPMSDDDASILTVLSILTAQSMLHLVVSIPHLILPVLHLVVSIFHLVVSIFHLVVSIFHLAVSIFHLLVSIFHLVVSIFHLVVSIFHLVVSIFKRPPSTVCSAITTTYSVDDTMKTVINH